MSIAVITGAGAVSAFGVGLPALFNGLREGRGAVRPIRSFDAASFATRVAGEVDVGAITAAWLASRLGPVDTAQRSLLARHDDAGTWRDRKAAFGLLAADEAWRMAGLGPDVRDGGLIVALGLEQAFLEDFAPFFADQQIDWRAEQAAPASGRARFRSEVDATARLLSQWLPLRGPVVVNASACAAGGLALAQAASWIERGAASLVLCGGADSMVNPFGIGGMSRLGAPSPRAEATACRPFDRQRDGLAIGEGAAMFVLESEERARRRGARPLARVLGHGSSLDAYRATAPRPDGAAAARAMALAVRRSGLRETQIGYVNAHGTGTLLNDVAESLAIRQVFGAHADTLPVSSIKGAVGHLMAASGAIEAAACLLPLCEGVLPGTANHRDKDPRCEIEVIGESPRHGDVAAVLSNSFGFGGQNVSLVLGRGNEAGA